MNAIRIDQLVYSPAEVARILGRTEPSVRGLIKRGLLPAEKWGQRIYVPKAALESALRSAGLLSNAPARPAGRA
jgi:excisionase family DNA binding protein